MALQSTSLNSPHKTLNLMSWHFIWSTWQTVVALLLVRTVTFGFVQDGDDAISCLEGRRRCYEDYSCRHHLEAMDTVCDETMYTCTTVQRAQCVNVLSALQTSHHFQSCICPPLHPDAVECLEQQKLIFLHACITNDGTHPNITWIVPKPNSLHERSEPDPPPFLEEYPEDDLSCIGHRKNCLTDMTCNEILREYRETCRESKKQGVCVATEKQRCFNAIQDLRSTAPEIFECVCPMRREESLRKCLHIQSRLANNTCLVAVPYFIHSSRNLDNTYNDLVTMVSTMANADDYDTENSCVKAFRDCNIDPSCRMRMAKFMNSCSWNRSANRCHRQECLDSIKNFYLLVRPERTHSLLFCLCRDGDKSCAAVQESLYPTCSVVEEPPPSCIDILDRCDKDSDCRVRWETYELHCGYDMEKNKCAAAPADCRAAQVGIMGTILTTNCTCVHQDPATNQKCQEARQRLQHKNVCKEMAIRALHLQPPTEPPRSYSDHGIVAAERNDCQRSLARKVPSFMNTPSVVRKYNNDSDCSELCECHSNGSLICVKLPCGPKLLCKENDEVHTHGSSFRNDHRGQCRCIKAEVVCAKATDKIVPKQGLFLHVGYSISDQYSVEDNSGIKFESAIVSEKLGALMNGDSAEQFCTLSLYKQFDGNLVFEISVSEFNPKSDKKGECIDPAKMISYMINSRNPTILTDAMLSILKVSQLEKIAFHHPNAEEMRNCGSTTMLPLVTILLVNVYLHIVKTESS